MPTVARLLLPLVGFSLISVTAAAQDAEVRFRLAQDPKNIQSCTSLDAAFTRVHTFTLKGGKAEIRSAGGVDDDMKMVRPNVYATEFALSGTRLDVVADLAATPRSLTITEKNRGCKWHGGPE
jgi:hypothetical protein